MKRLIIIAIMAMMPLFASAQNLKFAFVDFQELVILMPEMDEARTQLETASTEAQAEYQAMMTEYQTKVQQYEQKKDAWTPAILESKQKEIQEIGYRLQEFEQTVPQELQQIETKLQSPIIEKAHKAVEELAKKKGVIFVFDKNNLRYVDPAQAIDLTPEARVAVGIPEGRTIETLQAELQAKAQAAQAAQQAQ